MKKRSKPFKPIVLATTSLFVGALCGGCPYSSTDPDSGSEQVDVEVEDGWPEAELDAPGDVESQMDSDGLVDAEQILRDSDAEDELVDAEQTEQDGDVELFVMTSTAFDDGEVIPEFNACLGDFFDYGLSPPLRWENPPQDTLSFALLVMDTDGGDWLHWALAGVPADVNELAEGISPTGFLPDGAWELENDFGFVGYGGPCPPLGEVHHYYFVLSALDIDYEDPTPIELDELMLFIEEHELAQTTLVGVYEFLP